jgi:hypothetical protein
VPVGVGALAEADADADGDSDGGLGPGEKSVFDARCACEEPHAESVTSSDAEATATIRFTSTL